MTMVRYDVFLSYADADSTQVNSLIDRLERAISGIRIFHQTQENQVSEFERTRIVKAIDESDLVIFAVSENSLADEDCEKEVMYAKNTGKRVVPYLLQGMALKGWLLYELGRINCVDSTNLQEFNRFIDTLRQKIRERTGNSSGAHAQSRSDNDSGSNNRTGILSGPSVSSTPPTPPFLSSPSSPSSNIIQPSRGHDTIETQLVFDHRTGEFVSRTVGNNPDLGSQNTTQGQSFLQSSSNSDTHPSLPEPSQKKLYLNGHEYVDLGLPSGLKWASCNVGSYKAEESGTFFAWGEVKPKAVYFQSTSLTYDKDTDWLLSSGIIDKSGTLTPLNDAARKNWGSSWRMPTKADFEELHNNTIMSWHRVNGIDGCMLKSRINGNCIFFPSLGRREGYIRTDGGVLGMFWSSSVSEGSQKDACRAAMGLNLFSLRETARYIGLNIRPVSD